MNENENIYEHLSNIGNQGEKLSKKVFRMKNFERVN